MAASRRTLVVALVVLAAGLALWLNPARSGPATPPPDRAQEQAVPPAPSSASAVARSVGAPTGHPRLVDLGAGKCVPCKAMAPILEKLAQDYQGHLEVVFLDVWENPEAGRTYDVGMIPTQIFFDGQGKELFRHEGFFSREEILATWTRLGHPLTGGQPR